MTSLIATLISLLQPVVLAGVGWCAIQLAAYIKAHTSNKILQGMFVRANDAVWSAVKEVQQTIVDGLREVAADGEISAADLAKVKQTALNKAKLYLGPAGLKILMNVLGISTDAELDQYLSGKIEAAVHDLKMGDLTSDPRAPPST